MHCFAISFFSNVFFLNKTFFQLLISIGVRTALKCCIEEPMPAPKKESIAMAHFMDAYRLTQEGGCQKLTRAQVEFAVNKNSKVTAQFHSQSLKIYKVSFHMD